MPLGPYAGNYGWNPQTPDPFLSSSMMARSNSPFWNGPPAAPSQPPGMAAYGAGWGTPQFGQPSGFAQGGENQAMGQQSPKMGMTPPLSQPGTGGYTVPLQRHGIPGSPGMGGGAPRIPIPGVQSFGRAGQVQGFNQGVGRLGQPGGQQGTYFGQPVSGQPVNNGAWGGRPYQAAGTVNPGGFGRGPMAAGPAPGAMTANQGRFMGSSPTGGGAGGLGTWGGGPRGPAIQPPRARVPMPGQIVRNPY